MPLTRDFLGCTEERVQVIEEIEEINGSSDMEVSEHEKNAAYNSIRRSVVKDKLNWSCQFNKGSIH